MLPKCVPPFGEDLAKATLRGVFAPSLPSGLILRASTIFTDAGLATLRFEMMPSVVF